MRLLVYRLKSSTTIGHLLHLVDAHEPVLGGVRLLHGVQIKVFVANLGTANTIVARWLAALRVDQTEAVIGQLVHETIEQSARTLLVHAKLSGGRVVIGFLQAKKR